ncbi:MAG: hypothetical protein FJ295_13825 [Planctomycetes bacterium]|nr:hypothetical protein [Planctomycetota bacterium]
MLAGFRQQPPIDLEVLEQLLLRVSRLVAELPEIRELDLNPVVVAPGSSGCVVLEARVRVDVTGR